MGQMKKLSDLLTLDELEFWVLDQMKKENGEFRVGIPCDCYHCPLANYLEDMGYAATVHPEEIHIYLIEGEPPAITNYTPIAIPSELTYFIGYCDKHNSYITANEAYTALEDARREISRVTSKDPEQFQAV